MVCCSALFLRNLILSCCLLILAWNQRHQTVACTDQTGEPGNSSGPVSLSTREETIEETASSANDLKPETIANSYLKQFGYMDEDQPDLLLSEDVFEQAIREFQRYNNITETGKLDERTMATMRENRCGNRDFDKQEFVDAKNEQESDSVRRKRMVSSSKWPKKYITYRVLNAPKSRRLHKRTVEMIMGRALESWSQAADVNFIKSKTNKADVEISFELGRHNCRDEKLNFNKDSRILAHAFQPGNLPISGDVHFNDNLNWSASGTEGSLSLLPVAIHQLGHSLGLGHSTFANAVMFPYANNLTELHRDDKERIVKIYGKRHAGDRGGGGGGGGSSDDGKKANDDGVKSNETPIACGARLWLPGPECRSFYDCRRGEPKLKRCPGDFVWNDGKSYCDFIHNVPECRNKYM